MSELQRDTPPVTRRERIGTWAMIGLLVILSLVSFGCAVLASGAR